MAISRGIGRETPFFGGQASASKYALMWQWSGGGGSRNGYGRPCPAPEGGGLPAGADRRARRPGGYTLAITS